MTRRGKGPLIPVLNAHNQEVLRILGVPSGRDRTLAVAQTRKADPTADKPKEITGEIDSLTAVENLLDVLDRRGLIVNKTVRGGRFGETQYNPTLVNANTPIAAVFTQAQADAPGSTTNLLTTVAAIVGTITLPDGVWSVQADFDCLLRHSAGDDSRIANEINGVETLSAPLIDVPIVPSERFALSTLATAIQGGATITCRGRYRSETSGTTTAKNPRLRLTAWRTA